MKTVCPKCGSSTLLTKYNPVEDVINEHCVVCDHRWNETPPVMIKFLPTTRPTGDGIAGQE